MQINNTNDLSIAIAALENKKIEQEKILKTDYKNTVEFLKPKNLLKAVYENATENGSAAAIILKTVGTIGTGLLGGKLLAGTGVLTKMAGTAINAGAADGILNNADKLFAWGKAIYNNLFKKKTE